MVDVKIAFEHNGQHWTHEFNVRRGSTISKLKQLMLAPAGTEEDASKFELRLKGRRVPDFVALKKAHTFEFEYLGKELGSWRAKEDAAKEKEGDTYWESDEEEAKAWTVHFNYDLLGKGDVEAMEATDVKAVKSKVEQFGYSGFSLWKGTAYLKKVPKQLTKKDLEFKGKDSGVTFYIYNPEPLYVFKEDRPKPEEYHSPQHHAPAAAQPDAWSQPQHQHQQHQQQQQYQAPPEPPKPAKPPSYPVQVTVRHAMEEMASEITVEVMSDCTVLDVRRKVMEALGEKKLSEVKLVKRSGKNFASFTGEEPLGARREFLSMGRSLKTPSAQPAAPAPAPAAAPEPPAAQWAPEPTPVPAPMPAVPEEPKELDIVVYIDRAMDFCMPVKAMKYSSLYALKESLAAMDPTGNAKPDDWFLGLPALGPGQKPRVLADDTCITEEHVQLDLVPKDQV